MSKNNTALGKDIFIEKGAKGISIFLVDRNTRKLQSLNTDELADYWVNICEEFPIVSIEDPFDENDWDGFKKLTKLSQ